MGGDLPPGNSKYGCLSRGGGVYVFPLWLRFFFFSEEDVDTYNLNSQTLYYHGGQVNTVCPTKHTNLLDPAQRKKYHIYVHADPDDDSQTHGDRKNNSIHLLISSTKNHSPNGIRLLKAHLYPPVHVPFLCHCREGG